MKLHRVITRMATAGSDRSYKATDWIDNFHRAHPDLWDAALEQEVAECDMLEMFEEQMKTQTRM